MIVRLLEARRIAVDAVKEIQYQIQRRSEWLESVSYIYVSRTLKEVKPDERWKTISNNCLNIEFVNVDILDILNDVYDKWSSKTIVINLTSYFEFTRSMIETFIQSLFLVFHKFPFEK